MSANQDAVYMICATLLWQLSEELHHNLAQNGQIDGQKWSNCAVIFIGEILPSRRLYTRVHMYACTNTHAHARMYAHMHMHAHTCTYTCAPPHTFAVEFLTELPAMTLWTASSRGWESRFFQSWLSRQVSLLQGSEIQCPNPDLVFH